MEVRDCAEAFETLLAQPAAPEVITASLAQIGMRLSALTEAINAVLPTKVAKSASATIDLDELRELCIQLATQLETDDFASSRTIDTNEALLRSAMGEQFGRFTALVEDYDFGGALEQLKGFALLHGIKL